MPCARYSKSNTLHCVPKVLRSDVVHIGKYKYKIKRRSVVSNVLFSTVLGAHDSSCMHKRNITHIYNTMYMLWVFCSCIGVGLVFCCEYTICWGSNGITHGTEWERIIFNVLSVCIALFDQQNFSLAQTANRAWRWVWSSDFSIQRLCFPRFPSCNSRCAIRAKHLHARCMLSHRIVVFVVYFRPAVVAYMKPTPTKLS